MYLKLLRALSALAVWMLFHGIPGAVPLLRWTTEARLGRVLGEKVRVEIRLGQYREFRLPLHRAGDAATTARCSTCDGGGCLDCTDPA